MSSHWIGMGKLLVGVFVFFSCTLLWFWAISTWDVLPVISAIVFTTTTLMLFDKWMMNGDLGR